MPRDNHYQHQQHGRRSREVNGDSKQQWGSHYPSGQHSQPHQQSRYPSQSSHPSMPPPQNHYDAYDESGWEPSSAGGSRYAPVDRSRDHWDTQQAHAYHHDEHTGWEPSMSTSQGYAHASGKPRQPRSWELDDGTQRGWEPPPEQPRSLKRGTWNREPASWDRPASTHPTEGGGRSWIPSRQHQNSSHQHHYPNGDGNGHQNQSQNRKRKRKNQGVSTSGQNRYDHYVEDSRGVYTGEIKPQSSSHRSSRHGDSKSPESHRRRKTAASPTPSRSDSHSVSRSRSRSRTPSRSRSRSYSRSSRDSSPRQSRTKRRALTPDVKRDSNSASPQSGRRSSAKKPRDNSAEGSHRSTRDRDRDRDRYRDKVKDKDRGRTRQRSTSHDRDRERSKERSHRGRSVSSYSSGSSRRSSASPHTDRKRLHRLPGAGEKTNGHPRAHNLSSLSGGRKSFVNDRKAGDDVLGTFKPVTSLKMPGTSSYDRPSPVPASLDTGTPTSSLPMQPAVLAPATGPIALTDAFDRRFVKNKRSSGGNNLMQQFFPGDDDDEAGTADQPPVATSSRGGGGWQRIDGGSSKTDLTSGAGLPQRPSDPQGVEAPSHGAAHLPATPMEVDAPPISEPVSTVSSTPIHSTSPRKPSTALTSTAHTPTAPSAASTAPVARDYATPSASAPNLEMAASSSKKGKASDSNAPPTRDGDTYNIVSQVGEGTFGQVYKAVNSQNNTKVALKRIRMEGEKDGFPVTAMREIKLLQSLRHENIVKLHEMMVSKNGSVYMVFEYMDHDLTGILSQQQFQFTPAHLKSLCHQMLAGVAYLHHKGVIHRDMKGSNILISTQGVLKLADFGLARFYQKRRRLDYTNRVITLWYRPPELLLGATVYGPEVDMWSVGCIMLELYVKKAVFPGIDEITQLEVIWKVMGTPTTDNWPGFAELPWYELVKPNEPIPSRFRSLFQKYLSPAALDLVEALLVYNPLKRITAADSLNSPFFSEEPAMELPDLACLEGEWHEYESKRERERAKKRDKRKSESAAHTTVPSQLAASAPRREDSAVNVENGGTSDKPGPVVVGQA